METLKPLIQTKEIKTNIFEKSKDNRFSNCEVDYDEDLDTILIRLVPPSEDEGVFYIDQNLAVIFRESDKEIVGLMIEDYKSTYQKRNKSRSKEKMQPKSDCLDNQDLLRVDKKVEEVFCFV